MVVQISKFVWAGMLSALMAPVTVQAVALGDLTNPVDMQTFTAITSNNPPNTRNLENQLFVDIYGTRTTGIEDNQVLFVFRNEAGGIASSIQGIYFDDGNGALLSVVGLIDDDQSAGIFTHNDGTVDFTSGGTPPNLPNGESIDFDADWRFTADSPAANRGINPGELFGVMFNLADGFTIDDLLAAKAAGDFRIGLRVIAIGGAGGDSYVNVVPEPGIVWLLGSGLMGLAFANRKRAECF
ncbi:hypothetical protein sS8_0612 [Methylocaldum marinum]|uniref:Ice-binding protein C-terminal domain-containing protein n=1 Tax=Methylocaldum marinum TaxID=1432792 RepID=A0A250KLX5_9GAMM|nr:PEP-CTERM sorting domain-containing protein [Methylocaldum marinum]BBA32577.1 hypothetical protein sS8_0612 [Methylocaldum marinum]